MQCTYYTVTMPRKPETRTDRIRRKRRRRRHAAVIRVVTAGIVLLAVIAGCIAGLMAMKTDVSAAETPVAVPTQEYPAGNDCADEAVDAMAAEYRKPWAQDEAEALAKAMWGEARGCGDTHMAGVAWCALNRVDSPLWPDDLIAVLAQKNQFCGYDPEYPVEPHILDIAEDVLMRYHTEKLTGTTDPGRVLPADYYYFTGDGRLNWFRTEYADDGVYWDWSLYSPYEN